MRKRWLIVSFAGGALAIGLLGTALAGRAAQNTEAIVSGNPQGLVETIMSGRMKQLLALRQKLDLSDDQRFAIRQIVVEHKSELLGVIRPLVDEHRVLRDAIATSNGDGSDNQTLRAAADEMGKRIGDAAIVAAKVRAQIAQVLTPQQVETINEFRKETRRKVDDALNRAERAAAAPTTAPM